MKLSTCFISLLVISFCSCNSGTQRTPKGTSVNTAATDVPAYISADSIMTMLSGEPLNLNFNLVDGGDYSNYEAKDSNRSVTISFATKTRKIKSVSYFINGSPIYPKMKDASALIQFFTLFNKSAGVYFTNNFSKLVDNKKAYESAKTYTDSTKNLRYTLDHSLFDVRDSLKRQKEYAPSSQEVYMVAEVRNMN